jgi:flagellar biosynthesis/type III secretory pathway chaperone
MDINKRITDLLTISERLADVIERENSTLASHDHAKTMALIEEKTKLSRIYESRIEALTENEKALAEADPELRAMLREFGVRVKETLDENARLLRVAIEATGRVVDMIAEAVKDSAPGPHTYGARGVTAAESGRSPRGVVPVSLDRSL